MSHKQERSVQTTLFLSPGKGPAESEKKKDRVPKEGHRAQRARLCVISASCYKVADYIMSGPGREADTGKRQAAGRANC